MGNVGQDRLELGRDKNEAAESPQEQSVRLPGRPIPIPGRDPPDHSIPTLRSINMQKVTRNLIATIGLAVAAGAPLTPARAYVQTPWARSNENNILAIKFGESWEETKERRQSRRPSFCPGKTSRGACETQSRCKWQKGTILHNGEGYCYPAK
jgi:hypothetical protein